MSEVGGSQKVNIIPETIDEIYSMIHMLTEDITLLETTLGPALSTNKEAPKEGLDTPVKYKGSSQIMDQLTKIRTAISMSIVTIRRLTQQIEL